MKQIELTRGKVALVDDEDHEWLSDFKWYATPYHSDKSNWRAKRTSHDGHSVYMHRVIMGVTDPRVLVDHIDGDGLNNCRSNLRLASRSQQSMNRGSFRGSTSQYVGVSWAPASGKWHTKIAVDRKQHHLGYFTDEVEAARAYDEAALRLHGEFAWVNFPDNDGGTL